MMVNLFRVRGVAMCSGGIHQDGDVLYTLRDVPMAIVDMTGTRLQEIDTDDCKWRWYYDEDEEEFAAHVTLSDYEFEVRMDQEDGSRFQANIKHAGMWGLAPDLEATKGHLFYADPEE